MKLQAQRVSQQSQRGFTLVEMIGVLAIIAILASLLIPRVFQAIGDSKISAAASSCNSIKAAVNEYYGKYGLLAGPGGAPLANFVNGISEDWDLNTLVAEGVAEKPFSVRIGNGLVGSTAGGSRLRLIQINSNDGSTDPATDIDAGAYNLDGNTNAATLNDVTGSLVVEAVLEEVDAQDAKDLNDRIDGKTLGATIVMTNDWVGRVKYDVPDANTLKTSVRVYMAHR